MAKELNEKQMEVIKDTFDQPIIVLEDEFLMTKELFLKLSWNPGDWQTSGIIEVDQNNRLRFNCW